MFANTSLFHNDLIVYILPNEKSHHLKHIDQKTMKTHILSTYALFKGIQLFVKKSWICMISKKAWKMKHQLFPNNHCCTAFLCHVFPACYGLGGVHHKSKIFVCEWTKRAGSSTPLINPESARGQSSLAQQTSSSCGSGTALASAVSQQLSHCTLKSIPTAKPPRESQCLLIKTLILEFFFKQMKLDQLVNAEHCGGFASNTIGRKKKKNHLSHKRRNWVL